MARRVLYREAADHSHHTLGPARRDQGDISPLAGVWLAGGTGGLFASADYWIRVKCRFQYIEG